MSGIILDVLSYVLFALGLFFFFVGSLGLIRLLMRLHAFMRLLKPIP